MTDELPLQPFGSRVLLRQVAPEHIAEHFAGSKLINPNAKAAQSNGRWEIVAVGDNVREAELQPGVTALVRAFATELVRFERHDYRMAFADDIIAVVTGLD